MAAYKQGSGAARLEIRDLPLLDGALEYLWGWWHELRAGVPGGMGIGPIPWTEADAWCRRTGVDPDPDEWALIRAVDAVYVEVMNADDPR